VKIHRITMPRVNAWLAGFGGKWLMIDAGKPDSVNLLASGMASLGLSPTDINLLVISHAHFDHVGGAGFVKRKGGMPVAIHKTEADLLRSGSFEISDGLNAFGRLKIFIGRHIAPRSMFAFEPVTPDLIIEGERRLDDFGFPATIIHTPGHSPGSISVLFDKGDLFIGDLAITQHMPGIWRHMPFYGSSIEDIKMSWRALLARGAKHVYPSHGRDFPASELADLL
jgi:glyoxylase-like metal-dependent hydrolase (beta-lactamase superfamily II)